MTRRSRTSLRVEIRQDRGEQFNRFVDIDDLARFGEQRRRLHVGREDFAVAVENVGPRRGDRVLRDAATAAVTFGYRREHHQAQRDHREDASERDDSEAKPSPRLHVAINALAIEQRAQSALPAAFGMFASVPAYRHRGAGGSTLPVISGTGASMAPIGSLSGAGGDSGRSLGQPVKFVELRRFDRLQCQMAIGKPLDAAGRIELRPFGAQNGDGVALAAQFAAQLGDALGLQGRIRT